MNAPLMEMERFWSTEQHFEDVVEVALVDAGVDPWAVAEVLRQTMWLTLTDPAALYTATPLVLYEELEWSQAEQLSWQLRLAGASVALRRPRQRYVGIRRPFSSRRAA